MGAGTAHIKGPGEIIIESLGVGRTLYMASLEETGEESLKIR